MMGVQWLLALVGGRGLPADTPAWEAELPSQVRHEAGG